MTPPSRGSTGALRTRPDGRRTVQLREQIESLEAEFDEAGLHVVERAPYRGWSLGPIRPIAPDRLGAGRLGWVREIRRVPDGTPKRDDGPQRIGELLLMIHPGGHGPGATDRPTPGAGEGEVAFAEECRITPAALLVARSEERRSTPSLRRLAAELKAELEESTRED